MGNSQALYGTITVKLKHSQKSLSNDLAIRLVNHAARRLRLTSQLVLVRFSVGFIAVVDMTSGS